MSNRARAGNPKRQTDSKNHQDPSESAEIPTTAHVLAIALLLFSGCTQDLPTPPTSPEPPQPADTVAQLEPAFEKTLPRTGGPDEYTGSESCRSCHQDEFDSWHRSYHRTMTQIAEPESVQANFDNVTLTNETTRFVLKRKGDEFWVRMEAWTGFLAETDVLASLDTRIGLITGSHHMQVFWVPAGEGNAQIGFPFTWLIPEKRWVPRNSTFIRPPDMPHRSEIWNLTCIRCHATGIEPRVDAKTRTVDTHVGELGISCEACHGPGQRHVELRHAERDQNVPGSEKRLPDEIVHPRKIDPVRASQICGFCHSMKWIDKAEDWRSHGFRFRPGDDLEETTPIIRPAQVGRIPELAEFLERNPDMLSDFFWPDGMVRVSGRDYNGLIESPCYKGGEFSCLSCHSMHKSDPNDQLARNRTGNAACTQCHEQFRDDSQLARHTRHQPASSGSECYNCHMPHTTYGVLKAIRSHQISSPRVADQLATGRPNACNLCHLDKSLAWTADHLAKDWNQPKPELSGNQTNVADVVRLALSGDAGGRALAAWHLSWAPALETGVKAWVPAVLANLLDDPYAAVRCIAERSLREVGQTPPPSYDFTLDPVQRLPIADKVIEEWNRTTTASAASEIPTQTLVRWNDVPEMRERFRRIAQDRDDTPVRLRE